MKLGRFAVFLIGLASIHFAESLGAGASTWEENENYVLRILANGNAPDLHSETDSFRKFGSKFLYKLLTLQKEQVGFRGVHIRGAIFEEDDSGDFTITNLEVPFEVEFEHCEFRGKVDWSGCRFSKGLSFARSVFKADARFERTQMDGHFDLREALFEHRFDARYARISGNIFGGGTLFQGRAWFNELAVGHSVDFFTQNTNQATYFGNSTEWNGANIGHKLVAWHARFEGDAKFDALTVGGTVWMDSCTFGRYTSFGYGKIGDDFHAANCSFAGEANFDGLKCGGRLVLANAIFKDRTDFANIAIANDLYLWQAMFRSRTNAVSFYAMDVKGSVFIDGAHFSGPVNFVLATVGGNFRATNSVFLHAKKLEQPTERGSTFNADFGSLTVDGFTFFNKAIFKGDVSFRNARVQNLVLDNVCWPRPEKRLRLEGLSYVRIRSVVTTNATKGPEPALPPLRESWQTLKKTFNDLAPYSYDVYQNLESYFRREGAPELADEVFIEAKRRERIEAALPSKCWSTFLDWTVGQGRYPGRAFLISLVPLAFGAWCFRIKNMKPADSKKESKETLYSSIWFSLDLYLPILDLWIKNRWEPKSDKKWVWAYACLHKFIGWILVPVGLAAFAGIIK